MMHNTISRLKVVFIFLISFLVVVSSKGENIIPSDSTRIDSLVYLSNAVVVSALRYEQFSLELPQATSVFNNDQIASLAPMSMPDVLAEVPGVWMQKTNLGGGSPFVRGLTGYQVLMLIDGVRFNNSTFRSGPNQYLSTIDPLFVDKLEVVRGQGSVQYGSDAIGGVINILSEQPKYSSGPALHGVAYSKYLSHSMEKTGRLSLILSSKSSVIQLGATYKNFGDVVAGGSLGTLIPTGYSEYAIDLKLRQRVTSKLELSGAFQHHKQMHVPLYHKIVTEEYSTYEFDPQQRDLGYLRWKFKIDNKAFRSISYTASYQRSLEVRKKQRTGDSIIKTELDEVQTFGNTIEFVSIPVSKWMISYGFEFYHDGIRSSANDFDEGNQQTLSLRGLYPDNAKTNNLAVFALNSISFPKWNFSFGARYNSVELKLEDDVFGDVSIMPKAVVGNAGAVYKINKYQHVSLSLSSGFRAPNINDVSSLGEVDFRYEVPNYNLLPEKSLMVDMGWKIRYGRFAGNFHLYQNSLTDLITNVKSQYMGQDSINSLQVYTRVNANSAIIYGIETDINYMISSKLQIDVATTYTYGRNISANEPMRRIPPLFSVVGTTYNLTDRVQFRLGWKHANDQTRLSQGDKDDSRIPEGGSRAWNVFDLSVHYVYKYFAVRAGVDNIFNEAYRTHGSGIDGAGRSLWLAAQVNF